MNRLPRRVLPVVGLLWMMGCGPDGCGPPVQKIRIGAVYALTGSFGTAGNNQLDAAALAAEEINKAGGVLGAHLEIHVRDDASVASRAAEAATDLIENVGVKAMLGSNPSPNTLAVASVTVPAKVVQISSGSTSTPITTLADDGYLYRTVPAEKYQFRLQAQRAYQKGFRRMAILHFPGGEPPALAFEQAFIEFGGTISFKGPWVAGRNDYRDYLTEVFSTDPDACTLIGPVTESAQIIRDYVAAFIGRGTFWFFMNAQNQDFVIGAGPENFTFPHEGTRPTIRASNSRFPFFQETFMALYSREPNNFGESNAFDAVYLLALAMQAAGPAGLTDEPERIRDQMLPISRGGTAYGPGNYREAVAALARGEDIDYQGASGDVDFDQNGDVLGGFDIWQVQNGVQVNVETDIPPPP
jgi:ABC-type branched-subunit amino acid transport system substrate-binding protein